MKRGFRDFLGALEGAGELKHVKKPVDPRHLSALAAQAREATLFESIADRLAARLTDYQNAVLAAPQRRFLMKEVHLVSSMTYSRRPPRPDFATALALLAAERDLLAPVITHRVPLRDVARGFALAADKTSRSVKVAVAGDASPGA